MVYLASHEWLICMVVDVGKLISPMDGIGKEAGSSSSPIHLSGW